jgi:hypothetical protein
MSAMSAENGSRVEPGPGSLRLPDTTVRLPLLGMQAGPRSVEEARRLLARAPDAVFSRLLRERETPSSLVAARLVIEAFLPGAEAASGPGDPADAVHLLAELQAERRRLGTVARRLAADPNREVVHAVLAQRAPLALIHGCWLEAASQPATQPAVVVNRLHGQHFLLQGEGNPRSAIGHVRRRALENIGVFVPELTADDFLRRSRARTLTATHASFYLALSRLPATFLPEVVGVHCAVSLLGLDDVLLGTPPMLAEDDVASLVTEYVSLARQEDAPDAVARMCSAARLAHRLETEHLEFLVELAHRQRHLTLDDRVFDVIARHAPFAGRQHGSVMVAGRKISEWLSDPTLDVARFMTEFKQSRQVRERRDGSTRFLDAIRFGGPMFGIFDEAEARALRDWVRQAQTHPQAELDLTLDTAGAAAGRRRADALHSVGSGVVPGISVGEPSTPVDDRELLFRLVNIENFPETLEQARRTAEAGFDQGTVLWTHGADAKYTDASWFDYSRDALLDRVDSIYWDKLVNPYRPLTHIPGRDEVLFSQRATGLGALVDGAWAHRIGHLGRYVHPADGMLYSIYADEMGRGDERKNHVALIVQVFSSMGIHLPRLRAREFLDQDELPDSSYGFALHQLSMALFPDTFYNEILGYNLGIEMFGLGELRLQEMQRLRHHGFDVAYEEAHLSIDNFSAGHARQAAEIIVAHLDGVERSRGIGAVPEEWRRIWRGYASFAYFVERPYIAGLPTGAGQGASPRPCLAENADVLI